MAVSTSPGNMEKRQQPEVMRISFDSEPVLARKSQFESDEVPDYQTTSNSTQSAAKNETGSGGGGLISADKADWLGRGTTDPYVRFEKAALRLKERSLIPYNLYIKYINPAGKLTVGGFLAIIKIDGQSDPYIGLRSIVPMKADKLIWVSLNTSELYIRKSDYEYMKLQNLKNIVYQKYLNKELTTSNK